MIAVYPGTNCSHVFFSASSDPSLLDSHREYITVNYNDVGLVLDIKYHSGFGQLVQVLVKDHVCYARPDKLRCVNEESV